METKEIIKLTNEAIEIRGKVITAVALLEGHMDLFLSMHFSKDDWMEAIQMVFATRHISFDSKRDIILSVLKKNYAAEHKKHPKFSKELQEIAQTRNVFAHYSFSGSQSALDKFNENKAVIFLRHQQSQVPEEFDAKRVEAFMRLILKNVSIMENLCSLQNTPSS